MSRDHKQVGRAAPGKDERGTRLRQFDKTSKREAGRLNSELLFAEM